MVLTEWEEARWFNDLQRVNAVRGQGRNKLRTYRLFKNDFATESYVQMNMSIAQRRAIAQFRTGVAPLALETGRYIGTPAEERYCFHCKEFGSQVVENEEHVILACPLYNSIRSKFLEKIIDPEYGSLPNAEKMSFILANDSIVFQSAKFLQEVLKCRRACLLMAT